MKRLTQENLDRVKRYGETLQGNIERWMEPFESYFKEHIWEEKIKTLSYQVSTRALQGKSSTSPYTTITIWESASDNIVCQVYCKDLESSFSVYLSKENPHKAPYQMEKDLEKLLKKNSIKTLERAESLINFVKTLQAPHNGPVEMLRPEED